MNPVPGRKTTRFSSNHPGLDFAAGIGTAIKAPLTGTIVDLPGVSTRKLMGNMTNTQHWPEYQAGKQNSGNVINLSHGNGVYTSYLHVSPFNVSEFKGKVIKQGDTIWITGNNGWSDGPHLHFEVWSNGVRIDPEPWLNNIKQEDLVKLTYKEVVDVYQAYAGYPPSEAVLNWAVSVDAREVYERILKQEQDPNYPFLKDRYNEGYKNFKPYDGKPLYTKE